MFQKNKNVRCETRNPIARVLETAGFGPNPLVGPASDLVTTDEGKHTLNNICWYVCIWY